MTLQTWVSTKGGVWITWTLATTIGWGLEQWGMGFLGGVVLQWLVLRKVIVKAWWWIIATVIAVPIASLATGFVLMAVGNASPSTGIIATVVAFIGIFLVPRTIVGAAQCMVLLNKVPDAGWWIVASAGGMALYQAALFLGREWLSSSPYVYLLTLTITTLAFAIITGGVLVWLLQKRGEW